MTEVVGSALRRSELLALGMLAQGGSAQEAVLQGLMARGLVDRGGPADDAAEVANAIAAPLALVEIRFRRGTAVVDGLGWLGEEVGVVAFPRDPAADDPECDLLIAPSVLLTTELARFLELGPRKNTLPECTALLTRTALERLTGAKGAVPPLEAADLFSVPGKPECLASLTGAGVAHWRVVVRDPDDVDAFRVCEAIDCGAAGYWAVVDLPGDSAELVLIASTPSRVWRLLSSLVADDDDGARIWPEMDVPGDAVMLAG